MWTYSLIFKEGIKNCISKAEGAFNWMLLNVKLNTLYTHHTYMLIHSYRSYLCCSCLFEQFNNWWDGVASHNGIVNENYSFSSKVVRQRPKFLGHPKLTQTSIWLNKCPANVAVFTQDLYVGQARLVRQNNTCGQSYNTGYSSQIQTWRELSREQWRIHQIQFIHPSVTTLSWSSGEHWT